MAAMLRKSPPVCIFISLMKLLTGKIKYSKGFIGTHIKMEDDEVFEIFRHVKYYTRDNNNNDNVVFIVRFKFAKFSHNTNKFLSVLPMLLITGFPGFKQKIYAVNCDTGYWQGMYQWESKEILDEYRKSFVFKVMNKRAAEGTVKYFKTDKNCINRYTKSVMIK